MRDMLSVRDMSEDLRRFGWWLRVNWRLRVHLIRKFGNRPVLWDLSCRVGLHYPLWVTAHARSFVNCGWCNKLDLIPHTAREGE